MGFVCILIENEYNRDIRAYWQMGYHYAREHGKIR